MLRYMGVVVETTPVYVTLCVGTRTVSVPRMEIQNSVKSPYDLCKGDKVYFTLSPSVAENLGFHPLGDLHG